MKSRIFTSRLALSLTGSLLALAAPAAAQTITFDGLTGANGDPFTGPYVEQGFTVTVTGGQVFEGHVFGNPTPSLVVGNVFGGGNLGVLDVSRGSGFVLTGFDLSAQNGNGNYTVDGYLGAASVFSFGGAAGAGFSTYAGNAAVVDRLVFTLQPTGTSMNFDNMGFSLSAAIPEPATWAMLILGFGLVGGAMRAARTQQRGAISFS